MSPRTSRRCSLLALACLAATATVAMSVMCPDVRKAARHFNLNVTEGTIRLPDGKKLKQLMYNSQQIGPALFVNLGEEVSVDIKNVLPTGMATSTHWHGIKQTGSSWADGVQSVSQSSYLPGNTFRYKFKAEPAGTFWYHSHTGAQFADGLRGPLIVRDPKDPYMSQYDEERIVMVYDQGNASAEEEVMALKTGEAGMPMGLCPDLPPRDYSDTPFYSIYANGKGYVLDAKTGKALGTPYILNVKRGRRYRVRTIQGSASWAIKLQPMNHTISIIAADGANVKATPAKGYIFTPGERVDFILHANQAVGNYWVNLATLTGMNSPFIIHYEGAPMPSADPKLGAPKLRLGCGYQLETAGIIDFKDRTLAPFVGTPQPPAKARESHVVFLTNNADPSISMSNVLGKNKAIYGLDRDVKPQSSCPMLSNGKPSQYCWSLNWVPYNSTKQPLLTTPPAAQLGAATYVQDIKFGSVVDIAFINPSVMVHPMHIHGYTMWVLGTGNGNILNSDGTINYSKLKRPAEGYQVRDTVPVPQRVAAVDNMGQMGGMTGSKASPSPAMGGMTGSMASPSPAMGGMTGSKASPSPAMGGMTGSMASPSPAMGGMGMMSGMADSKVSPSPAMSQMGGMGSGMGSMGSRRHLKQMPASMGNMEKNAGQSNMSEADAPLDPKTFGYTVVRFQANNPGVWAFHCHIEPHASSGMFMVLRVQSDKSTSPWTIPTNMACKA